MEKTYDQYLAENAQRILRDVARRSKGEKVITHVPTGFNAIDDKFGGVRMGIATEVMAHTGDGKSSFLRQCQEGCAKSGGGGLYIVAEDPEDATTERQFSSDTGIDTTELGRLDLTSAQVDDILRSVEQSKGWAKRILPIFEAQTVESVLELIDETTTIGGAPLREVAIDYAQVLAESRNLEDDIAKLGAGVHERSRARGFATIIGSQVTNDLVKLGRDAWVKNRDITRMRPSLGDTEWCRRLEKLCKAVWSLFRPGRWMREFGEACDDDTAELHVIKANFGPMGWAELGWDGPTCTFRNI